MQSECEYRKGLEVERGQREDREDRRKERKGRINTMEAPKKKKQTDAMDACYWWARLHHPISAVQSQAGVAWKIARYSSIRLFDDAIGSHRGSTVGGLAWPVQGALANQRRCGVCA